MQTFTKQLFGSFHIARAKIFKEMVSMKNYKKAAALLMALTMTTAVTACGGGDGGSDSANATTAEETTTTESQTEWTGDNIEVEGLDENEKGDVDISGQTIKYLGISDINPTNSNPERSVPLTLFEDTYGAKVEYIATTSSTKFTDLANLIMSGDSPDIFLYEWMAFPYGVSKGQYQPIDDLVDFSKPMWEDMKGVADDFVMGGKHYVAPLGYRFYDSQVLMYNADLFESEGIDDPKELYESDAWDWDAFVSTMKKFVDNDPENRYGIAGWWSNAFVFTAGETLVQYDGNTFTNNINSPALEKAEFMLEDMTKNKLILNGWINPSEAFTSDTLAFYGMGTWAFNDAQKSMEEYDIQIVPFPKAPDSDTYYVSNALHSYMWVKGSDKADAVKIWFECCRRENYDEQYTEVTKAKLLENNPYWTSEKYDFIMDLYDPDKFTQVFDYAYGISDMMSNTDAGGAIVQIIYEGIANENEYSNWTQIKNEYSTIIDQELKTINESIAAAG